MPGTIHDTSAMNIKGMWKADGVVQLSEEIELTVIILFELHQLFQQGPV